MAKLAVTGHDVSTLIDCSEAVPEPQPAVGKPATFPAGTSASDLDLTCASAFPSLSADGKIMTLLLKADIKNPP